MLLGWWFQHKELSLLSLIPAQDSFMTQLFELCFGDFHVGESWLWVRDDCFLSCRSALNAVRLTPSGWVWLMESGSVWSAQENTEAWESTSGQPCMQTLHSVGFPWEVLWLWTERMIVEGCRVSQFQHFLGTSALYSSPKWALFFLLSLELTGICAALVQICCAQVQKAVSLAGGCDLVFNSVFFFFF